MRIIKPKQSRFGNLIVPWKDWQYLENKGAALKYVAENTTIIIIFQYQLVTRLFVVHRNVAPFEDCPVLSEGGSRMI